ncbi:MAG: type II toxin-antitoxin system antitoxin SocA domain-containing protein [Chitinophagales bacterium]
MGLQLKIEYSDLLQLVQQLSPKELQQLKKDVNNTIKASQKTQKLLQYLIYNFQLIEESINNHQLNGLFYLIDFGHYALYQKSITGFTYQKSSNYPFSPEIEELLKSLNDKEILTQVKVCDTFVLSVKNAPSFKSLYLSKEEKATIKKTLDYFEELDDFDFSKEIKYHYSWIGTKDGEVMGYEKAKFCDFEWLDYFYDKSKEEFEELKKSRAEWNQDTDIQDLLTQIQKL